MGTLIERITGAKFCFASAHDIKNLSVKELYNPETFDLLLNPTVGGLYDPALGPNERLDVCITCGLGAVECPGHFGHISLALPVYHLLYYPQLFKFLRCICPFCYQLNVPTNISMFTSAKLKAMQLGGLGMLNKLESELGELFAESNCRETLEIALEIFFSTHKCDNVGINTRNVVSERRRLLAEILERNRAVCCNCDRNIPSLRMEAGMRLVFAVIKLRRKITKKKKKKGDDDDDDDEEEKPVEKKKSEEAYEVPKDCLLSLNTPTYLTAVDVSTLLDRVWNVEKELIKGLFGIDDDNKSLKDLFIIHDLPVPPSRFRPISMMEGKRFENRQTAQLSKVLVASQNLRNALRKIQSSEGSVTLALAPPEMSDVESAASSPHNSDVDEPQGMSAQLKQRLAKGVPDKVSSAQSLQKDWAKLQSCINSVLDSTTAKALVDPGGGIKQILEKKEGLFRMNMMGKRVNYAARSVISPDLYIDVDEIGIPLVFATRLSYPEPVTPWNERQLRQMIINGPKQHPGATMVELETGKLIKLNARDLKQREAVAKTLLNPPTHPQAPYRRKRVFRHLINGDFLLLNRQPTLHRPSIQAHRARVLPGLRTLRLHYACCKAYNADFDGDEMNAHLPQSEQCRAEASHIASVPNQYIIPKDGTPIAGLIQDHMVSGVLLSLRGRFFSRDDYHQLVYGALSSFSRSHIALLPPTVLKPCVLWSGKQVISTVLMNVIPQGKPHINITGKSKVSSKQWQQQSARKWKGGGTPLVGDDMTESQVIIREGELLCGVLDKAHYGATSYGLVHACSELYGGSTSSRLLTALARLFTGFLTFHGFTLGVEDILCTPKGDKERARIMSQGEKAGYAAVSGLLGLPPDAPPSQLERGLRQLQFTNKGKGLADLDHAVKKKTEEIQSGISKACMGQGLHKVFPFNNLQLMVQAGAKGSVVNCMQISCLLGQIELEGRRPPLMISGRTLPSFLSTDMSPRAGGFIDGRFLTGIRPQEYFYHCMAGREGLIDTAVKTSRSGYLQRCLIKHLEGLMVGYDLTVRDSDSSVVQFQYGEDGTDVTKTAYLNPKQFAFMSNNRHCFSAPPDCMDRKKSEKLWKKANQWKESSATTTKSGFLAFCEELVKAKPKLVQKYSGEKRKSKLVKAWRKLNQEERQRWNTMSVRPDPVNTQLEPNRHVGSVSERLNQLVDDYITADPDHVISKNVLSSKKLKRLINARTQNALVQPGEGVGLLAAQSIGEPSTQMTLNTFHFAGRGEMNVTLGIPRLREILMVASNNIMTPLMEAPVLPGDKALEQAELHRRKLNTITLNQVLQDFIVEEIVDSTDLRQGMRQFKLTMRFLPEEDYQNDCVLTASDVLKIMEDKFFTYLVSSISRHMKLLESGKKLNVQKDDQATKLNERARKATTAKPTMPESDSDEAGSDVEAEADSTQTKSQKRRRDDAEYEGEDEEKASVAEDEDEEKASVAEDEGEDEEKASVASRDSDAESVADDSDVESEMEVEVEKTIPDKRRRQVAADNVDVKVVDSADMDVKRVNGVLGLSPQIIGYKYDSRDSRWCEIILREHDLTHSRLDLGYLMESEARLFELQSTPGIRRAMLAAGTGDQTNCTMFRTEGINSLLMFEMGDFLDLNRLYSNNVHTIANMYGIEAANRIIIQELRNVFAVYGIDVNYRHLSLIADYMTFEGTYKPFNRFGLFSNASPLQKATFETTLHFLKMATLTGARDELESPSARLVVGGLVKAGTGCFDVLTQC